MAFFGPPYFGPPYFGGAYFGSGEGPGPAAAILETALMAALQGHAPLAAIVGPRVYPVALPQSAALPALYFRFVSRKREHDLDGGAGYARPRVQFGACSTRHSDLRGMGKALRSLLDGFSGSLGAVRVGAAWCAGEMDLVEDYGDGSGRTLHVRAVDYFIHHHESVPAPQPFAGSAEDLEAALVACVKADAALAALVGGRIYPGAIPQSATRPAIWYRLLKAEHEQHLDAAAGLCRARWRWGVQSRSYSDVAAAAELLRLRFQGFSGQIAAASITSGLAHDESDQYHPAADGSDRGFYERFADFTFHHRETVPEFG